MSEVIDVVTRLTYEANLAPLEKSIGLTEQNADAVVNLINKQNQLEKELSETNSANLNQINKLTKAIGQLQQQYDKQISTLQKDIATQQKLIESLNKQGAATDVLAAKQQKLQGSSQRATQSMTDLSRIVQDAPFGFIGIANNINPALEGFQRLRAETGSFGGALKALGTSLIGAGGIGFAISAISSLLVVFGDKLFNTKSDAEEAAEGIDKATSALDKFIDKQIRANELDKNAFGNASVSQRRRDLSLEKALDDGSLESFQKIFQREQDVRQEELNAIGKRREFYNRVNEFFKDRKIFNEKIEKGEFSAKDIAGKLPAGLNVDDVESVFTEALDKGVSASQLLNDKIAQAVIDDQDKRTEIQASRIKFEKDYRDKNEKIIEDRKKQFDKQYKETLEETQNQAEINALNDKTLELLRAQLESSYQIQLLTRQSKGTPTTQAQQDLEDSNFERERKRIEGIIKVRELELKATEALNKARVADNFGRTGDKAKFQLEAQELNIQADKTRLTIGEIIDPIKTNSAEARLPKLGGQKINESVIDEALGATAKAQARREKNFQSIISSYTSLAQTITAIMQSISDAQIARLNEAIDTQAKRVEESTELAKRGGAEVLKEEQERLNKLTQQREAAAKRQIEINALVQASNTAVALSEAIGAIIKAAAQGDPYTIAARVIAAVGALVGGIFALKSAFASVSSGYAEGGYTGDGGKYEPAGTVHKGEFVFSKEATRKYGVPFLEAMHEGRLSPRTEAFASGGHFRTEAIEKRLDRVAEAVEGLTFSASQNVDKHGVNQMVQTTMKDERLRWRR